MRTTSSVADESQDMGGQLRKMPPSGDYQKHIDRLRNQKAIKGKPIATTLLTLSYK